MIRILFLIVLQSVLLKQSVSQSQPFDYYRDIQGVHQQWHQIILPNDVLAKAQPGLEDIRVFAVGAACDTFEVPYLLQATHPQKQTQNIYFEAINVVSKGNAHYFTYDLKTPEPVNALSLDVGQTNFDWTVVLEGSQQLDDWLLVKDDFRLVGYESGKTRFSFTQLVFPTTTFRYLRLKINHVEKPVLNGISITHNRELPGILREFPETAVQQVIDKANKTTILDVRLSEPLPVGFLKLLVRDTTDFYRPFTVSYVLDSVPFGDGIRYSFADWFSGVLSSKDTASFQLPAQATKHLRITIYNQDNFPLTLSKVQVGGYPSRLVVRFPKAETYFLAYGNAALYPPKYDLTAFKNTIPETLELLSLGKEHKREEGKMTPSLFANWNIAWLWVAVLIVMFTLVLFSIKMLKQS